MLKKVLIMIALTSLIILNGCTKYDCVSEIVCEGFLMTSDNIDDKCIPIERSVISKYQEQDCKVVILKEDVKI